MDVPPPRRTRPGLRACATGSLLFFPGLICAAILWATLDAKQFTGSLRPVYLVLLWVSLASAGAGFVLYLRGTVLLVLEGTNPWRQLQDSAGLTAPDREMQRRGWKLVRESGGHLLVFALMAIGTWFTGWLMESGAIAPFFFPVFPWALYLLCGLGMLISLVGIGLGLMNLFAARLPKANQD